MLTRGIVAFVAATAFSNAVSAADLPQTPAGLVGGIEGAGEAPLDLADRPGFKLSKSFRLRFDISDRLNAVARGVAPARTTLLDRGRGRRIASMLDFYPMADNGFHLSAGMRKLPRPSRRAVTGIGAGTAFDVAGPGAMLALGARSTLARKSPTMMAGWTGLVAKEMQVGFSAGAAEEHGKAFADGAALGAAGGAQRWSRVGGVAQVNLGMRF